MPRSTAEATRKMPSALAAAAASPAATPITDRAAVARSPGCGGGPLPAGGVPRRDRAARASASPAPITIGPAPADGQRDGRHRGPGQQGGDRDGGLLDAEREAEPGGRHVAGQGQVGRRAGPARCTTRRPAGSAAARRRSGPARADGEHRGGRRRARRAGWSGRTPKRSTSQPQGSEASALTPK